MQSLSCKNVRPGVNFSQATKSVVVAAFFFFISLPFQINALAAEAAQSPQTPVVKIVGPADVCGSHVRKSGLLERIEKEYLVEKQTRTALVEALRTGTMNPCREELSKYIDVLLQSAAKGQLPKLRPALLSLALSHNLPDVQKVMALYIEHGVAGEWLDSLKALDDKLYFEILGRWVSDTAQLIRINQNLGLRSPAEYGMMSLMSTTEKREAVKLVSPLVVNRYLNELSARKKVLTQTEILSINALFAGTSANDRQLLLEPIARIFRRQESDIIVAFRQESVWAAFKLLPLLGKLGGPEMARELMWLSQNHKDVRMRSVASRTLDEMVDTKR